MQLKELPLTHVAAAPREPGAGKPPLLIMAHGVGANEQDLMGLAPYADPRFLVVSVRAPRRYQYGGFSWFDIHWQPSGFSIDTSQAVAGWELLQRFAREAVEAYGADPARVYLAGFSQGAITSLGATLTDPALVAGTVVMSGRWMPEIGPQVDQAAVAGKPLLVVHGEYDDVIPVRYGREIRDYLQTLPVALTYREHRMGHEVSLDSLRDVTAWLQDRLDDKPQI
ncbi:MAG TPA: phospholipase [Herpetosiphonaceae bacterium]|nr:phospholipase [Herpetosiphonaceae bacterium]